MENYHLLLGLGQDLRSEDITTTYLGREGGREGGGREGGRGEGGREGGREGEREGGRDK